MRIFDTKTKKSVDSKGLVVLENLPPRGKEGMRFCWGHLPVPKEK